MTLAIIISPLLLAVHHELDAGTSAALDAENGYVTEERIINLAKAAGFELAARSDMNRNKADDHEHPNGVWTLPPSLAVGNEDPAKYQAIGESDRMTLKFVKPVAKTSE